uniref:Uncharacterized protein n=1 Tax=Wuchereria bancrofti TaxID=6293 RepID=A0AAF5Q3P7_WUCBA
MPTVSNKHNWHIFVGRPVTNNAANGKQLRSITLRTKKFIRKEILTLQIRTKKFIRKEILTLQISKNKKSIVEGKLNNTLISLTIIKLLFFELMVEYLNQSNALNKYFMTALPGVPSCPLKSGGPRGPGGHRLLGLH